MIVCNNIQEGTESEKTKSFSEDINIDTTPTDNSTNGRVSCTRRLLNNIVIVNIHSRESAC